MCSSGCNIADFTHPKDPSLVYPFVRNELDTPENMMKEIVRQYYNGEFQINRNLHILTRTYADFRTDSISSHFSEDIRALCHQLGKPNLVEVWKQLSPEKIRSFAETDDFRLYAGQEYSAKECGLWSPVLAMHLIMDYRPNQKPIKILDPSSGWGDRLIAAIMAGDAVSEYHGYDPSKEMAPRYQEIIDRLDIEKKCQVTRVKFELAEIKKGYYDLAMTSPPYYDLEIYSLDDDQSTSEYKSYREWLKFFYTRYLLNMRYGVRKGGTMIVYVSDYTDKDNQKYNLEEDTIDILTKRASGVTLRLKGGLQTKLNDAPRPFFVFDVNE